MKFKEFDYEESKKLLANGFDPIPFVECKGKSKRKMRICISGFSSEEEAIRFVQQYLHLFPANSFFVRKGYRTVVQYEYSVIAPRELYPLLSNDKKSRVKDSVIITVYNDLAVPSSFYRTIGNENVKKLFEQGEMLLSTFKRCRALENEARRDKYELRNIIEIYENNKKMEVDIGFDDSLLVLCTSLPPINDDTEHSAMFKITNVAEFVKEITNSLLEMGFGVAEVLYGPCIYNDKVITIETDSFVSYFIKNKDNTNALFDDELVDFIEVNAENDIIMNKPSEFMHEQEYRFVWKLTERFDEEQILIKNPKLAQFCERLE